MALGISIFLSLLSALGCGFGFWKGLFPSSSRFRPWPLAIFLLTTALSWSIFFFLFGLVLFIGNPQDRWGIVLTWSLSLILSWLSTVVVNKVGRSEMDVKLLPKPEVGKSTPIEVVVDRISIGRIYLTAQEAHIDFYDHHSGSFSLLDQGEQVRLYQLTLPYAIGKDLLRINMLALSDRVLDQWGYPRRHMVCVPPNLVHANEALAWTFGMGEEEYGPIIET